MASRNQAIRSSQDQPAARAPAAAPVARLTLPQSPRVEGLPRATALLLFVRLAMDVKMECAPDRLSILRPSVSGKLRGRLSRLASPTFTVCSTFFVALTCALADEPVTHVPPDLSGFKAYVVSKLAPQIGDDSVVFTSDSVLQLTSLRNGQRVDLLFWDIRQRCVVEPSRCDDAVDKLIDEFAGQLPMAKSLRDAREPGDDSVEAIPLKGLKTSTIVPRSTPSGWDPSTAPSTAAGVPLTDAAFSAYLRDRFQLYSPLPVTTRGTSYPITVGRPVGITLFFPTCMTMTIPAGDVLNSCRRAPDGCRAAVEDFMQTEARAVQEAAGRSHVDTSRSCKQP